MSAEIQRSMEMYSDGGRDGSRSPSPSFNRFYSSHEEFRADYRRERSSEYSGRSSTPRSQTPPRQKSAIQLEIEELNDEARRVYFGHLDTLRDAHSDEWEPTRRNRGEGLAEMINRYSTEDACRFKAWVFAKDEKRGPALQKIPGFGYSVSSASGHYGLFRVFHKEVFLSESKGMINESSELEGYGQSPEKLFIGDILAVKGLAIVPEYRSTGYPGFKYSNPRCPFTVTKFLILSRNIKKDVYFKKVASRMGVVKGCPEVINIPLNIRPGEIYRGSVFYPLHVAGSWIHTANPSLLKYDPAPSGLETRTILDLTALQAQRQRIDHRVFLLEKPRRNGEILQLPSSFSWPPGTRITVGTSNGVFQGEMVTSNKARVPELTSFNGTFTLQQTPPPKAEMPLLEGLLEDPSIFDRATVPNQPGTKLIISEVTLPSSLGVSSYPLVPYLLRLKAPKHLALQAALFLQYKGIRLDSDAQFLVDHNPHQELSIRSRGAWLKFYMEYDPSDTVTCSLKHILELDLPNVGSIEIRQEIPDALVIFLLARFPNAHMNSDVVTRIREAVGIRLQYPMLLLTDRFFKCTKHFILVSKWIYFGCETVFFGLL
uniref:SET domain-containing protein n=1 Tax=Caenorhabditis tropicalis TaxID=1561998 RepID=A0A1I7UIK4_9PELO